MNYLLNNFFGMNLECQLAFLDEIYESKKEIDGEVFKEFEANFSSYYNNIRYLLSSKKIYDELNINQRHFLKFKLLGEFSYVVSEHHSNYSKLNNKNRFIHYFCGDFFTKEEFNETMKRYFNPKVVAIEDAEEYIEQFRNSDVAEKNLFLDKFNSNYVYLNFFEIPVEDNVINEFEDIVYNVLDEDLYSYYNQLHERERIYYIQRIAFELRSIKDYEKDIIIDDKEAVENQKLYAIDACIKKFL